MTRTLLLGLVAAIALDAAAQIPEGDRQWNLRAEGHIGGRAVAAPVDAAIAAYRRALANDRDSLEASWRLLRALRFKGAYVARSPEEKKRIYGEAKLAGDEAMRLLTRVFLTARISDPSRLSEKVIAERAGRIDGVAEIYLWDAINWGEWALVYGKLAAVREGAADRIKRGATIAYLINPSLEGGAPARVLGRLHDQTPRVPFITGWASGTEAVRFLREAAKADPDSKITKVFLAEAMVNSAPSSKPRATTILKETIAAAPHPEYVVEESAAQEDAKGLLKQWGAK